MRLKIIIHSPNMFDYVKLTKEYLPNCKGLTVYSCNPSLISLRAEFGNREAQALRKEFPNLSIKVTYKSNGRTTQLHI